MNREYDLTCLQLAEVKDNRGYNFGYNSVAFGYNSVNGGYLK